MTIIKTAATITVKSVAFWCEQKIGKVCQLWIIEWEVHESRQSDARYAQIIFSVKIHGK